MKQYISHTGSGRIGTQTDFDPVLALPSFCSAYLHVAHAFGLWMWLQNEGRYRLTFDGAVDRMALLTGVGVAYARDLVRQGFGELWDRHGDGGLQLRRPGKLQRQAYVRTGVGKHSVISMPIWLLGAGLEFLHAYLALPVMSSHPDKPTARQYTAGILGVRIASISRWRVILRSLGVLSTIPVYHRLGAAKRDRQLAARGCSRVFRRGNHLFVRDPDLVAVVGLKINRPQKGLRPRFPSPREAKSYGSLVGDADKYGWLSDRLYELADLKSLSVPQWSKGLIARARKLISRARWRTVHDPATGQLDPEAAHQLILAEAKRLTGQRRRAMDGAYYAPLRSEGQ